MSLKTQTKTPAPKADPRLKDKQWRMSHLYFIKNKQQQLVQFKPNRAQRHFLENAWFRNVILKSRQLGFTTLEVIDMLDDILFERNTDALLIAQNLDTAKDIFDNKIYLAWHNFRLKDLYQLDMESARRLKVGFGDGTFSSMSVDSSGRAGTFHRLHVTELAKVGRERPDKAKEIVEGSIPAVPTDGRVDIESTSEGVGGLFHQIFINAWGVKPKHNEEFKAHFYNWTWDEEIDTITEIETALPKEFVEYKKTFDLTDKQITYYYRKWLSLNQNWNSLRKEYPTTPEEAFEVITEGAFYAREMAQIEKEGRIKVVPYDPGLPVYTVWDLGVGDLMAIGFYQRVSTEIRLIDYYQNEGYGFPHYAKILQDKPYVYGKHFAPHDIRNREMGTGKTRLATAKKLGIEFEVVPKVSLEDGIDKARIMFARLWISTREECKKFISAAKQYHKKWDEVRGTFSEVPFHDWTSNPMDMLRYTALVEDQMTNKEEGEELDQPPWEPQSEYEGAEDPAGEKKSLLKEMGTPASEIKTT